MNTHNKHETTTHRSIWFWFLVWFWYWRHWLIWHWRQSSIGPSNYFSSTVKSQIHFLEPTILSNKGLLLKKTTRAYVGVERRLTEYESDSLPTAPSHTLSHHLVTHTHTRTRANCITVFKWLWNWNYGQTFAPLLLFKCHRYVSWSLPAVIYIREYSAGLSWAVTCTIYPYMCIIPWYHSRI